MTFFDFQGERIVIDDLSIVAAYEGRRFPNNGQYYIDIDFDKSRDDRQIVFGEGEQGKIKRDEALSQLDAVFKKKKGLSMGSLKEYLSKHKDMLFTVAIVIVLDQVVFEGAFREKLKKVVDNMLDKVSKAA